VANNFVLRGAIGQSAIYGNSVVAAVNGKHKLITVAQLVATDDPIPPKISLSDQASLNQVAENVQQLWVAIRQNMQNAVISASSKLQQPDNDTVEAENALEAQIVRINEQRVDEVFDSFVGKVNQQRQLVKEQLRLIRDPAQVDLVVQVWESVSVYLMWVVQWIQHTLLKAVGLVQRGYVLTKDVALYVFYEGGRLVAQMPAI